MRYLHAEGAGLFSEDERVCEECGETFWSRRPARFCSQSCRLRAWRARQFLGRTTTLVQLCREVADRSAAPADGAGKLLPRLFRATAAELRRRGWDPIELLMSTPDEPAAPDDMAPGGVEGTRPQRRRWLHPPAVELEKLEALIVERKLEGHSVSWHLERAEQIREYLIVQGANDQAAKAG